MLSATLTKAGVPQSLLDLGLDDIPEEIKEQVAEYYGEPDKRVYFLAGPESLLKDRVLLYMMSLQIHVNTHSLAYLKAIEFEEDVKRDGRVIIIPDSCVMPKKSQWRAKELIFEHVQNGRTLIIGVSDVDNFEYIYGVELTSYLLKYGRTVTVGRP